MNVNTEVPILKSMKTTLKVWYWDRLRISYIMSSKDRYVYGGFKNDLLSTSLLFRIKEVVLTYLYKHKRSVSWFSMQVVTRADLQLKARP